MSTSENEKIVTDANTLHAIADLRERLEKLERAEHTPVSEERPDEPAALVVYLCRLLKEAEQALRRSPRADDVAIANRIAGDSMILKRAEQFRV